MLLYIAGLMRQSRIFDEKGRVIMGRLKKLARVGILLCLMIFMTGVFSLYADAANVQFMVSNITQPNFSATVEDGKAPPSERGHFSHLERGCAGLIRILIKSDWIQRCKKRIPHIQRCSGGLVCAEMLRKTCRDGSCFPGGCIVDREEKHHDKDRYRVQSGED